VSATKLVLALGVTQPDLASCIAQLASHQQAEVNRDEKDQRSKMVSLTAAGMALVQKGKRSCGPMWSRPCAVSAADRRALCLYSWKLADELAITPLYITGVEGLRGATLHILDRLIWHALRSHQSAQIEGGAAAPRYKLDVAPFAACMNIGRDSLLALAGIISRNAGVVLPQAGFYPTTRSCN